MVERVALRRVAPRRAAQRRHGRAVSYARSARARQSQRDSRHLWFNCRILVALGIPAPMPPEFGFRRELMVELVALRRVAPRRAAQRRHVEAHRHVGPLRGAPAERGRVVAARQLPPRAQLVEPLAFLPAGCAGKGIRPGLLLRCKLPTNLPDADLADWKVDSTRTNAQVSTPGHQWFSWLGSNNRERWKRQE